MIDRVEPPSGEPGFPYDSSEAESVREVITEDYDDDLSVLLDGFPSDQTTLAVSWVDIERASGLGDAILSEPGRMLWELDKMLRDAVDDLAVPTPTDIDEMHLRVNDLPNVETKHVANLRRGDIGRFIGLRGDLAKVGEAKTRYTHLAFICANPYCTDNQSGNFLGPYEQQRGRTMNPPQRTCDACGKRTWAFYADGSEAIDSRIVRLKDPPGSSGGSQPDIAVYVDGDDLIGLGGPNGLTDRAGESVVIYGQYKIDEMSVTDSDRSDAVPDVYFVAEDISFERNDYSLTDIKKHRSEFEELAAREDAHELVRNSIAPQLYQTDELKDVLDGAWMYLFGAPRTETETVTRRGDIHMMMVGDPATGKSTVVRGVKRLSPRVETATGGNVTGVALTASADHDEHLGWYLEPGVLPRASGGHAIVDELDKVPGDAVGKLHDALEGEQRISVAKANVRAQLNTRCGLLGAANPIEGRFDKYAPLDSQIDVDPALMSRFDLVFTLIDEVDMEKDTAVVDRVIESASNQTPAVDTDVLRAWIAFARQHVHPEEMTDDAKDALRQFYLRSRQKNEVLSGEDDAPVPATSRLAEAARRCSAASARLRLSDTIELGDVEIATGILNRVMVDTTFDPETGTFDAGRGDEGGRTRNGSTGTLDQTTRIAVLKSTLADWDDDADGPDADELFDAVTSTDAGSNYPREKFDHDLSKLREKGDVYAPKSGQLRLV